MADEAHYSSDGAANKRKYDDHAPPPSTRRATGFSAPIASQSPDSAAPSYNSVAPPADDIQIAKQRAQEIAARLFITASAGAAAAGGGGGATLDSVKRPRVENGGFDSGEYKGFSSAPPDAKPLSSYSAPSAMPMSYGGFNGPTKKIEIPNGRVGVIIGKGGETIKYLQLQSGAKIQITRDAESDPNSTTRSVELSGPADNIAKAESLIKEVLQEAETGGSALVGSRITRQGGGEQFTMRIPNNKVGLVIGKGGDTIKTMQATTGARIQVIPLRLPPGDTSTERTVQIEGTNEQIEHAKQLVAEVTSENRQSGGGYQQQGYQARPTSWGSAGTQMPQSGYGYGQPGAYPGQTPQYNMTQPPYSGYPPQQASWDQSNAQSAQQTTPGGGYDYYGQQQSAQQQQAPGGPVDNTGYSYNQAPASGYNQQGQGYTQEGYGGYQAAQYGQPGSYDQQGYNSAPNYGNLAISTQDGKTASYGAPGETAQAPPSAQSAAVNQQGYSSGQLTSPGATTYPPQGASASQPGYGTQTGYANTQTGYGPAGYGAPAQGQKPQAYSQTQPSPTNPGGYGASAQPTYSQPDSASQRAPASGYGAAPPQAGYGAQPYGAGAPGTQQAYGQAAPSYNSYGGGYSQPPAAYSGDGEVAPAARPSGVAKSSPPS